VHTDLFGEWPRLSAFKDTASTWVFLGLALVFTLIAGSMVEGLKRTKFTDSDPANVAIVLAIIGILMILLGRVYFVKVAIKTKTTIKDLVKQEAERAGI